MPINIDDLWVMSDKDRSGHVNSLILKINESLKIKPEAGGGDAANELGNLLKEEYSLSNLSVAELQAIKDKILGLPYPEKIGADQSSQYNVVMWMNAFYGAVIEAMEKKQQQNMIQELLDICHAHKVTIESLNPIQDTGNEISEAEKLSKEKLSAVNRFIAILKSESGDTDEEKLKQFKKEYADSKGTFTQGNDSVGKLFVNSISCVFSQGIKAAYSMWKEGVKAIERTKQIDELVSISPKNP